MKKNNNKASEQSVVFRIFRDNEVVLKRFLRRFTSNPHDIDDICQETIMRALEAEKTRVINMPRAFLFGVTKNIVRKKLDKDSKSLLDFIEGFSPQEYLSNEPQLEDCLDSQRRMVIFMEAVAVLPRQCQKVFLLKKVHGYSHKEIAKDLGISISTVEKHVALGLKRCSEYMSRKGENEAFNNSTVNVQKTQLRQNNDG